MNKIALVTGASVGIGRNVAEKLTKHGMKVVACARNEEQLKDLADVCNKESSGEIFPYRCDVTDEEQILSMFKFIKEKFGKLHVCVNSAGLVLSPSILTGSAEVIRVRIGTTIKVRFLWRILDRVEQGFSNFFVLRPHFKTSFFMRLFLDSLDVNDTCNVQLQISRRIFVYGEIIQMHTIRESNYTVIKPPPTPLRSSGPVVGNHRAAAQCRSVRNLLPVRAKQSPNCSKNCIFLWQIHRVCLSEENPTVGLRLVFTVSRLFAPLG